MCLIPVGNNRKRSNLLVFVGNDNGIALAAVNMAPFTRDFNRVIEALEECKLSLFSKIDQTHRTPVIYDYPILDLIARKIRND